MKTQIFEARLILFLKAILFVSIIPCPLKIFIHIDETWKI